MSDSDSKTLYILRIGEEEGERISYRSILYTQDSELLLKTAREHNPRYPERERWDPRLEVDEITLDHDYY